MTSRWLLKSYQILNRTFEYAKPQMRSSSPPGHFTGHGPLPFSCPTANRTARSSYREVQNLRSCNDENNVSTFSVSIFNCHEFMMKENEEWGRSFID